MAIIIHFPAQQTSKALPVPPAKAPVAAPNPRTSTDSQRKAMLAKVHIAKAHCVQTLPNFDEDMYRHILQDKYGVDSAKDLNHRQLHQLLLHFAGLGFEAKKGRHRKQAPATLTHDSAQMGREALMQKIEAQLAEKGSAEGTEMPWAYAVAILKKQSGGVTKAFAHATPEQLNAVIAALYRDAKRKGRRVR